MRDPQLDEPAGRARHLDLNRLARGIELDVEVGVGGLRRKLATTAASAIALHAPAVKRTPRWASRRPA